MYLNFYGLSKEPFSLAPDPEFLYLSQQHKDALGAIIYGIKAKQGFVSVVGEVGTGKTTIVRTYLQKAGRNKILPVFIFNSRITFAELMETFLREIGISNEEVGKLQTVNEMVTAAHRAMIERNREGKTIVLIIDEAQNMPTDTLAKLCILSNFETTKAKLVQIVLVGQPELQKKLALRELRQLRQRIAFKALITPLSKDDSVRYFHHRLELVAKKNKPVFSDRAIKQVTSYSKGVPRIINIICENSLVAGYALQKKPVSSKIVKQVIAEHKGDDEPSRPQVRRVANGTLAILLPLVFIWLALPHFDLTENGIRKLAGLVNFAAFYEGANGQEGSGLVKNNQSGSPLHGATSASETKAEEVSLATRSESHDSADIVPPPKFMKSFSLAPLLVLQNKPLPGELDQDDYMAGFPASFPATLKGIDPAQLPHLKIVQKGDTVSTLCESTYGFVNSRVLRWIKTHNPHIRDLDEIQINEIIFFPEMEIPNVYKQPRSSGNKRSHLKEEIVSR